MVLSLRRQKVSITSFTNRHLRHGEPLLTDAADVLLVIRLIEAAWKSSKEGNVVKL